MITEIFESLFKPVTDEESKERKRARYEEALRLANEAIWQYENYGDRAHFDTAYFDVVQYTVRLETTVEDMVAEMFHKFAYEQGGPLKERKFLLVKELKSMLEAELKIEESLFKPNSPEEVMKRRPDPKFKIDDKVAYTDSEGKVFDGGPYIVKQIYWCDGDQEWMYNIYYEEKDEEYRDELSYFGQVYEPYLKSWE